MKTAKKAAKKVAKKAARPITKSKFDKMTPAQKRVAIAKDVLKQIAAKKYVAEPGTYARLKVGSPTSRIGPGGL